MDDQEEWRAVPGHALLEASSWGRVRSKPYKAPTPNGGERTCQVAPTYGVTSRARSTANHTRKLLIFRRKSYKVARLVCLAFHGEPPEGRRLVLHEDENSANNRPGNLSWGTQKENLNAPGFIAYCKGRTGENSPTAKARRARQVL